MLTAGCDDSMLAWGRYTKRPVIFFTLHEAGEGGMDGRFGTLMRGLRLTSFYPWRASAHADRFPTLSGAA